MILKYDSEVEGKQLEAPARKRYITIYLMILMGTKWYDHPSNQQEQGLALMGACQAISLRGG